MPKFLNNLDLSGNQLLNPVIHVVNEGTFTTAAMDSSVGNTEGQIFYNSNGSGKKLYYRDNSDWKPIGDITNVIAGNGLQDGGDGGDVTLNIDVSDFAGVGLTADNVNEELDVSSAQTGIVSIRNDSLSIGGYNSHQLIDFTSDDVIQIKVDNSLQVHFKNGVIEPHVDDDIDLGTASKKFKSAWFDGTVTSDAFAGPLTGNADTATALETGRTISMTGDVAWTSDSFDGTGDVAGTSTIGAGVVHHGMLSDDIISGQANSIAAGSLAQGDIFLVHDTSASEVKKITYSNLEDDIFDNINGDGTIAAGGALTVTGANGNFSVGGNLAVTGNLTVSGTTTTVNSTVVSIADNLLKLASNQSATDDLVDFGFYGQYGSGGTNLYAGLYRDRSVTGDPFIFFDSSQVDPGTSTDIATGGTYDLAPVKAGEITAVDGFVGDVTGNADTASALAASVNINGVAFDGSAGITVAAAAGTLTGTTLASGVVTSSLTTVGTISSGTWTAGVIDSDYLDTDVARSKTFTLNNTAPVVANAGASASTAFTITHAMGASYNYKVEVMQVSDHSTVFVDVTRPTTETIVVTFASAVALGDYVAMVTSC